jgi:hypothetical protein
MEFNWLSDYEIETWVNPLLKERNWAELNINPQQPTCRVMGAFIEGVLIEFLVQSLFPMTGPLLRVNTELRDSGETSRKLAEIMHETLRGARDYMVVCNNPMSERLCKRFGMKKLESPVYVHHPGEPQST